MLDRLALSVLLVAARESVRQPREWSLMESALDWLADQWRAVEKRFPFAPRDRQLRELVRTQIGLMVNDVLTHTREQVQGIASVQEVRGAGRQLAGFSPAMGERERVLKRFMYERIREWNGNGVTIILISHDMGSIFGLCRRVVTLSYGDIICDGTPDETRANPAVLEAYLGDRHDAA